MNRLQFAALETQIAKLEKSLGIKNHSLGDPDDDAGNVVDAKVRAWMADHPGTKYVEALREVLKGDAPLRRRYEQSFPSHGSRGLKSELPGDQLHSLALAHQAEHPKLTYTEALRAVSRGHKDLVTAAFTLDDQNRPVTA